MDLQRFLPFLAMPILLVIVELGALALSLPVQAAGITAFEDPESLANPVIFIAILLVFTSLLLVLIKFGKRWAISAIIWISIFLTFGYIFSALVVTTLGSGIIPDLLILMLSIGATVILNRYPEWYVIDTLGILIAAGVASIFGASLETLPVVILLILLAVYDAISVYKTKHMITLAEGVIDLKTPILFVIPKKKDYSFIRDGLAPISGGGERAAFIMGMGDLIMPSILVVSANVFIRGTRYFGFVNLPALGAIAGSLAGLLILLWFVNSGKPQAGLPPLNGGTIAGFATGLYLSSLV